MNGETFVVYTTETGGFFKTIRATEEQYRDAVESGQWDETPRWLDVPLGTDMVNLKFIALLRVEANHDFVLGCSRDDVAGIREHARRHDYEQMKSALGTA